MKCIILYKIQYMYQQLYKILSVLQDNLEFEFEFSF